MVKPGSAAPARTEAGHRRHHHVKRLRGIPAVGARVGQRADQLGELDDRVRPAVRQQQRQRVRLRRADVQEVHVQAVDLGDELGEVVQPRLVRPPVVTVRPVLGQLAQVRHRHPTAPAGRRATGGASGCGPAGRAGRRGRPAGCRCEMASCRDTLRAHVGQILAHMAGILGSCPTPPPDCCACCRCCRRPREWPGSELADPARASACAPSAATWSGCATSATRCRRRWARSAATAWSPARPCRRCCSTTTRRWRSRSVCAPPPARGGRHRGGLGAGAGQARTGAAVPAAPPGQRAAARPPNRCCAWDRPTVDPEHLTALAAAVSNRERLRFDYRPRDGVRTPSGCVEPYRLVSAGRRWYLVAYDNDRDDWRIFRVDRIDRPAAHADRVAAPGNCRLPTPPRS